jgi:hypothetical protein
VGSTGDMTSVGGAAVAKRHDLPLILHTRKAEARTFEILKVGQASPGACTTPSDCLSSFFRNLWCGSQEMEVKKADFHCYGGKVKLAKQVGARARVLSSRHALTSPRSPKCDASSFVSDPRSRRQATTCRSRRPWRGSTPSRSWPRRCRSRTSSPRPTRRTWGQKRSVSFPVPSGRRGWGVADCRALASCFRICVTSRRRCPSGCGPSPK